MEKLSTPAKETVPFLRRSELLILGVVATPNIWIGPFRLLACPKLGVIERDQCALIFIPKGESHAAQTFHQSKSSYVLEMRNLSHDARQFIIGNAAA